MKVQIIKNSKIQIICTRFLTFLARTETVSYPVFNFNELTYRLKILKDLNVTYVCLHVSLERDLMK